MKPFDRSKGRPEPVSALDRIREIENGDPLVELRVVAPDVVIVRETTIPVVRGRVAEMAQQVALSLPAGVKLGVTDAWRPLKRQQLIYEFMTKCAQEAYPDRIGPALTRTVNRWVAPTGRVAPPGHCTGAAIDVVLIGTDGEHLDMSSPFDRIEGGPTFVYGLSEAARNNRMLLYGAMISAGFSNCRDEWWHYSFGDAGWAVRLGLQECCYGLIEYSQENYQTQQEKWEKAIAERANPFLPGSK
ncbi:MAG: M15 family metallopeptidase [Fimbriimonadaceae bacterium]